MGDLWLGVIFIKKIMSLKKYLKLIYISFWLISDFEPTFDFLQKQTFFNLKLDTVLSPET